MAHTGPVIGLSYTNDGRHLISLGKDNALRLWNSSTGVNTLMNYGKVPHNTAVAETCLQISLTDGTSPNYALIPSGNNLLMYDIFEGSLKKSFKGHFESVNCCKYNPVMCEFYTGSKDRNILVWSPEKQQNLSESRANFRSSSLPKNAYSIFSSTGRSGFSSGPQTVNSSENNLEDTFAPNASNRRLDTWSDDE